MGSKSILFVSLLLVFVACGEDEETQRVSGGATSSNSIIGKWSLVCELSEDATTSSRTVIEYKTDGSANYEIQEFADVQCFDPLFTVVLNAGYINGQELADGIFEHDVTSITSFMTIFNPDLVVALNSQGFCDSNFELDVAKEVTKESCPGEASEDIGGTNYGVYKVEGDKLYLGDSGEGGPDGSSASQRTTTLGSVPANRL